MLCGLRRWSQVYCLRSCLLDLQSSLGWKHMPGVLGGVVAPTSAVVRPGRTGCLVTSATGLELCWSGVGLSDGEKGYQASKACSDSLTASMSGDHDLDTLQSTLTWLPLSASDPPDEIKWCSWLHRQH